MANQEQLIIIVEKGVEAWNKWRVENPGIIPDLKGIYLCNVELQGVNFSGTDLSDAVLRGIKVQEADLSGAHLKKADLQEATLRDANVNGADLRNANFTNTYVDKIKYNRETRCMGIRVATCYGSPSFKRFAQDQEYIEMIKESHPWLYRFWAVSSDCGRSLLRWVGWSAFFALLFAVVFHLIGKDGHFKADLTFNWITEIYYSIVTFTTLGFGDVTPTSIPAIILVTVEVIIGYIMLGGLISILASKLARRS